MTASRPGLAISHDKTKSYGWQPTYHQAEPRYQTRYRLPRRTRDPFRQTLRDYFTMEEEKDSRQYGALEDVIARTRGSGFAEPRWMEALKPLLSIVVFGEFAAMKSMSMLIDTVDNPELKQGYMTQMLDEIRHTNVEAYLIRYLAKHAYDPAGFNSSLQTRVYDPICLAGRAAFETFLNDDPITCAINLQVITETAYTNPLFVATTEISAANNDPATPSVFLSVQSDEARHMANGYATLAAVLSDSDNLPLLQHDLDASFWRQHMFLDNFLGAIYDYFPTIRLLSYAEYWDRWVWDDWVGSYLERLAPFGLRPPRWIEKARKNVRWGGHTTAMFSASTWPLHPWRSDRMLEADFGYLEDHYPGWHKRFGPFWEAYDAMSDPLEGVLPFDLLGTAAVMCRVCQLPAIYPLPELADPKYLIDASDRRHALCSEACEEIFLSAPHRYQAMTWQELYGGMALSEYIVKAGLVRPDGKTLVGQPHLHTDEKRLWTIDDIRRADVELRDPLLDVALEAFRRIG